MPEDRPAGDKKKRQPTTLELTPPEGLFSQGFDILPGTRYQLERLLGEGGTGHVYRGVHLELEKPVAVKVLHRDLSKDVAYAARFRREAKSAASIKHPGVVEVTDFGSTSDGRLFLVMELIEGQTISEVIQRGPIDPHRAVRIAAHLAEVLEAVHQVGIIHRDVKPGNIFLLGGDRIKLVDFGIARGDFLGGGDWRITKTGKVMGTTGYMAPEQARGAECDHRADLYSVGAVLYEMLTASPPFRGNTPVQVLMAQMKGKFTPPSKAAPDQDIPPEVDHLVKRLISLKVERRFDSAAELAQRLHKLADRLQPVARGSDAGRRSLWRRKPKTAIGAAVAISAVLLGAAVGFVLYSSDADGDQHQIASVVPRSKMSTPPDSTGQAPANTEPETEPPPDEAAESNDPGQAASAPAPADDPAGQPPAGLEPGTGGTDEPEPGPAEPDPATQSSDGPPPDEAGASRPPPREPGEREPERRSEPRSNPAPGASEPAPPESEAPSTEPGELLQQARVALVAGRHAEAERLYHQARAAGADRASVSSGLGQLALVRGRHAEAARHLEQAAALRPGSNRLRIDLGRAYQGQGRSSDAIAQWRAVLERDPDNAAAQRLLRSVGAEP